MHITTIEQDGVTVINVVGKLNVETYSALKKRLRNIVEEGAKRILLDVSGITEMDSTGIGVMVALLNTVREKGGDLRLAGRFAPQVEEAFNLCGLARVFVQYPNVKDGISNFDL
ncbi:MAG: STAS domain-containing protein [bacterium]